MKKVTKKLIALLMALIIFCVPIFAEEVTIVNSSVDTTNFEEEEVNVSKIVKEEGSEEVDFEIETDSVESQNKNEKETEEVKSQNEKEEEFKEIETQNEEEKECEEVEPESEYEEEPEEESEFEEEPEEEVESENEDEKDVENEPESEIEEEELVPQSEKEEDLEEEVKEESQNKLEEETEEIEPQSENEAESEIEKEELSSQSEEEVDVEKEVEEESQNELEKETEGLVPQSEEEIEKLDETKVEETESQEESGNEEETKEGEVDIENEKVKESKELETNNEEVKDETVEGAEIKKEIDVEIATSSEIENSEDIVESKLENESIEEKEATPSEIKEIVEEKCEITVNFLTDMKLKDKGNGGTYNYSFAKFLVVKGSEFNIEESIPSVIKHSSCEQEYTLVGFTTENQNENYWKGADYAGGEVVLEKNFIVEKDIEVFAVYEAKDTYISSIIIDKEITYKTTTIPNKALKNIYVSDNKEDIYVKNENVKYYKIKNNLDDTNYMFTKDSSEGKPIKVDNFSFEKYKAIK